jgi:2-oxo-4-hydroxy-4-carboxy-5-ureidoimidazoline decarboxylase
MSEYTIETLNGADEAAFVEALGGVYERSPWVPARAWSERPFDDVADLHACLKRVVRNASQERKLELLRAHPDLGDQTDITDVSEAEQAAAGLDQLTPEQYETFQRLNERYRDAFRFPFIMAVRDESPEAIMAAMERRLDNTEDEEFQTALDEVHRIARFRLEDLLTRV